MGPERTAQDHRSEEESRQDIERRVHCARKGMSIGFKSLCNQSNFGKLESVYRSATIVANICIYADAMRTKPIAIIVPAEPALKKIAVENGIKGDHLEEMVHNEKLNNIVLKQLRDAGKKGGLQGIEIIEGVVLVDEEWTPQNGLLTSSQKLNRKGLVEKYKMDIDHAYSKAK